MKVCWKGRGRAPCWSKRGLALCVLHACYCTAPASCCCGPRLVPMLAPLLGPLGACCYARGLTAACPAHKGWSIARTLPRILLSCSKGRSAGRTLPPAVKLLPQLSGAPDLGEVGCQVSGLNSEGFMAHLRRHGRPWAAYWRCAGVHAPRPAR